MAERKLIDFSVAGHVDEMRRKGECVTAYTTGGQRDVAPFVEQSAKSPQVVGAKIDPPKHESMPDG